MSPSLRWAGALVIAGLGCGVLPEPAPADGSTSDASSGEEPPIEGTTTSGGSATTHSWTTAEPSTGSSSGDASSSGDTSSSATEGTDGETDGGSSTGGGPLSACLDPGWSITIPQIPRVVSVVHEGGTLFALGTVDTGPTSDVWLGAFSAIDGALQWEHTLDPAAAGLPDLNEEARGLGLLGGGDLVLALQRDQLDAEAAVLRLDPATLAIPWATTVGTAQLQPCMIGGPGICPLLWDIGPDRIAVGPGDEIVVGGWGMGELDNPVDAWLARLSPTDGSVQWTTGISIGTLFFSQMRGLAIDAADGIYVGVVEDRVLRFDYAGTLLEEAFHVGKPPYRIGALAVGGGEVAAAFTEFWPDPTQVMMVERRNAADLSVLSSGEDGLVDIWDTPWAAFLDEPGIAWVVGVQADDASSDGWIRAFDPAGTLLWSTAVITPPLGGFRTVTRLPAGGLVVGGDEGDEGRLQRFDACAP